MSIAYIRLYGPDGSAKVRSARTASDAGTWTPDAESVPKNFMLDAREWDSIKITPVFLNGGGAIAAGTNVTVTPLILVPDSRAATGRLWKALASTGAIVDGSLVEIAVQAHICAFLLSAVTLGAATSVDLKVTGGIMRHLGGGR